MKNTQLAPRPDIPSQAIDQAVADYIARCHDRVTPFVERHFSLSGAAKLNKRALGFDLLRAPLNVAWALPLTAVKLTGSMLKKCGIATPSQYIDRLPVGFQTAVQKEVNWLLMTQLLKLPCKQSAREFREDDLFAALLDQPEIKKVILPHLTSIASKADDPGFRKSLEDNLLDYARGRIAVSELAGSLISLSTGLTLLGKMTPGGLTFGSSLAAAIAQHTAISHFFLGKTLGSLYYGLFPAKASMGLLMTSTSAALAGLAIITALSGFVTDPVQSKLGLHHKRLHKLIHCLEHELLQSGKTSLHLREIYLSRIFDLIDLLRVASGSKS